MKLSLRGKAEAILKDEIAFPNAFGIGMTG